MELLNYLIILWKSVEEIAGSRYFNKESDLIDSKSISPYKLLTILIAPKLNLRLALESNLS